jgi:cytochrome P450
MMGARAINRPPGPPTPFFGLPLIGEITRDMLGFYTRLQQRYGDVAYLRLGPYHDYTVFHPAQIHEVLVERARAFIRMPRQMAVLRQWNGDSVLIAEHDTWLRYRRLMQPAFQHGRFGRYADEVTAATRAALDAMAAQSGPVDFEQAMADLTLAVICRTMFGTDLGAERAAIREAVHALSQLAVEEMSALVTPPDWLPLPSVIRKRRAIETLDSTVWRFIRERRASGQDHGDLLSMLLLAVDQEGDQTGLTDQQVRDQCVTIFLAGHDTTATGLIFLAWALASHPELAEQVAQDVATAIGDRSPTFEDLPKLASVERLVKETLRMYPPAFAVFARQATQDVHIGTYVTQHDPRWFPEPERFDPGRFTPEREAQLPTGAYIPFGHGPRVCIGRFFAMMELTLVATMLLQRFVLVPEPGRARVALELGMSLRPVGGMRLSVQPRRSA